MASKLTARKVETAKLTQLQLILGTERRYHPLMPVPNRHSCGRFREYSDACYLAGGVPTRRAPRPFQP